MPKHFKKNNKKRIFRKRRHRTKAIVQKSLNSPAIYPFKRSISQTIGLNTATPPEGWSVSGNNLYKNWGVSLAELEDYTEFTQLFKYYRLKGIRIQMYFSNTNSTASQAPSSASPNQQILMWIDTNKDGYNTAGSGLEKTYLTSQTAKKRLCLSTTGRPVDIYMSLRQQSEMYGAPGNTDYTTIRPRWVSTTEPTTAHYGLKMMMQRVDGQAFTSGITNSQFVKIIQTVYLQCKKVE